MRWARGRIVAAGRHPGSGTAHPRIPTPIQRWDAPTRAHRHGPCGEPQLLIADEPTTALDVTIQAQILRLIQELGRKMGLSVLLITHNLGVVAKICDRVAVMYSGRVIETAPVRDLFRQPLHPYTQGLLKALPHTKAKRGGLEGIPGHIPDSISPPAGCRFHPRCPHVMDVCREVVPMASAHSPEHNVFCHLYEEQPESRVCLTITSSSAWPEGLFPNSRWFAQPQNERLQGGRRRQL